MTNPYVNQTISGYNSSPPSDDGSATASNEVKWSTIKTKLPDPVKVLSEGIDSATSAAFDVIYLNATTALTALYTVQASDRGKLLTADGTFTITLLAAGTAGAGFSVTIKNIGSGTITIDGDDTETIDGALTLVLSTQYDSMTLTSDGSNWNAVGKSPIADNAVGLAQMAGGTDGNLITYDASGDPAHVATGTVGQVLTSNGAGAAPTMQTPIFSEAYTSSGQTITSAGQLVLAHSLSASPSLIQLRLKCTDAGGDVGYSQNDEVIINPAGNDPGGSTHMGVSVVPDATNITIRYGLAATNCIGIMNKSTGAAAAATNTKWSLIVKAWA